MAEAQIVEVSRLLDERGLSSFQIKLIVWSLFIVFIDGYDIGAIAFAAPHLLQSWGASPAALGPVFSASLIGILFGSWYTDPIVDRVMRRTGNSEFLRTIEEVRHFERMLVAEGALILKFWFHLSKGAQEKRLADLEKDPRTRWRVCGRTCGSW